ncbi:hypothetical protein DIPPA_20846 [Diplonema papillatum]|nr:hypothetical protein DIPPA_20846 [Diplonema papillatum]
MDVGDEARRRWQDVSAQASLAFERISDEDGCVAAETMGKVFASVAASHSPLQTEQGSRVSMTEWHAWVNRSCAGDLEKAERLIEDLWKAVGLWTGTPAVFIRTEETADERDVDLLADIVASCSTWNGSQTGRFDPASIDPRETFPDEKRLAPVLLAQLQRPGDKNFLLRPANKPPREVLPGVPRFELEPPLWKRWRDDSLIRINSQVVDEASAGKGPEALDVYGELFFEVTVSELSNLELQTRIVAEAGIPRLLLAVLLARFTADPSRASIFSARRGVTLCDLGSRCSESNLAEIARSRLEHAEKRRQLAPSIGEAFQQERYITINQGILASVEDSGTAEVLDEFQNWREAVEADRWAEFGFSNAAEAKQFFSTTLVELSSSLCLAQKGYFLTDGRFGQRNAVSPRTAVPVTFLSAPGIDFCSATGTLVEAPKYFERSVIIDAAPSHVGWDEWLSHGKDDLKVRAKTLYRTIFKAAKMHGVQYPSVLPLGTGSFLANLHDRLKPAIFEVYFEAQLELLAAEDWGFRCYLMNPARYFSIAKTVLEKRRAVAPPRCDVLLHDRDAKFVAQALAAEGLSAAFLNSCDPQAVLHNSVGMHWLRGKRDEFVGEEDFAATSTAPVVTGCQNLYATFALAETAPAPLPSVPPAYLLHTLFHPDDYHRKSMHQRAAEISYAEDIGEFRVVLEPGRPLGVHHKWDEKRQKVAIHKVDPNSPAEEAGVMPGVVLEAGGVSVKETRDLVRAVTAFRKIDAPFVMLRMISDETAGDRLSRAVAPLLDLERVLQAKLRRKQQTSGFKKSAKQRTYLATRDLRHQHHSQQQQSPEPYPDPASPSLSRPSTRRTKPAATAGGSSSRSRASPEKKRPPEPAAGVRTPKSDQRAVSTPRRSTRKSAGNSLPMTSPLGPRCGFMSSVPREAAVGMVGSPLGQTSTSPGPAYYYRRGSPASGKKGLSNSAGTGMLSTVPRLSAMERRGPGPGDYSPVLPPPEFVRNCANIRSATSPRFGGIEAHVPGPGRYSPSQQGGEPGNMMTSRMMSAAPVAAHRLPAVVSAGPGPGSYSPEHLRSVSPGTGGFKDTQPRLFPVEAEGPGPAVFTVSRWPDDVG